MVFVHF